MYEKETSVGSKAECHEFIAMDTEGYYDMVVHLEHFKLVHKLLGDLAIMELTAKEVKVNKCDVYPTIWYSSAYRRVFKHGCLNVDGRLHIILTDINWPVDDVYTHVLYHNNEPIIAYSFTLHDKQIFHLTSTSLSPREPIEKQKSDFDEDEDYYFGVKRVKVNFGKIALPEEPINTMEQCLTELNEMVGLGTLKSL